MHTKAMINSECTWHFKPPFCKISIMKRHLCFAKFCQLKCICNNSQNIKGSHTNHHFANYIAGIVCKTESYKWRPICPYSNILVKSIIVSKLSKTHTVCSRLLIYANTPCHTFKWVTTFFYFFFLPNSLCTILH